MVFVFEPCRYPSGKPYVRISCGTLYAGSAEKVEGGYLAQGRRKPVPTLALAAKQLIDAHLNRIEKERQEWLKAMRQLASEFELPPK